MAKSIDKEKDPFSKLEEKYGKNVVISANSKGYDKVKEVTSTGSLTLDNATGVGGVPKGGKITHILGGESSSKTTLSLHIIAEEQKKDKQNRCAFLDVEGTLDLEYSKEIGVDLSRLYIVNIESFLNKKKDSEIKAISGEEWLEMTCDLLDTKQFGIIVLDSVAELCPKMELEGGIQSSSISPMGRMMSKALRTINAKLIPTNTGLIFLNQYRMSPGKYGDPRIEVSGEALKFYTSLKIELLKSLDKDGDGVYGIQVKAKITKSKISIPYKEASYYVEFGHGIDRQQEIIDLAVEYKLLEKAGGGYYKKEGVTLAQGDTKMKDFMKENPEWATVLEESVLQKIKGGE